MRGVVLARDHPGGRGQRLVGVADVALDLAGLLDGGFELLAVGLGVVGLVGPVVPDDLERLAALERRPGVLGDHGDAAERPELVGRRRRRERDDLLHARHLEGRGGIDRGNLASDHGRPGDDGELHAGQHDVLAVGRLAGRDVDDVGDADGALADVAEGARLLELDLVGRRHRQGRCGNGELAVPELAPGGLVHHLVQLRLHLGNGHLPLGGRRLLQHRPRRGAALAHRLDPVAHAARAVGVLVAVGALVAWRLHHAHARPVRLKLVGEHHGKRGAGGPVAHLGARGDDADGTVAADGDEHLGIVHRAVRHRGGAGRIVRERALHHRELGGEDKTSGGRHALEQAAPADVADLDFRVGVEFGHVTPPLKRHGRPRARPRGCADSSRSGRDCRPWPRKSGHRWVPASSRGRPRPA